MAIGVLGKCGKNMLFCAVDMMMIPLLLTWLSATLICSKRQLIIEDVAQLGCTIRA
jgi:hypothetical protein